MCSSQYFLVHKQIVFAFHTLYITNDFTIFIFNTIQILLPGCIRLRFLQNRIFSSSKTSFDIFLWTHFRTTTAKLLKYEKEIFSIYEQGEISFIHILFWISTNRFILDYFLYIYKWLEGRSIAYVTIQWNPIKTRYISDLNPHPARPDSIQPATDPTRQCSARNRPDPTMWNPHPSAGRIGSGFGSGRVGSGCRTL